MSVIAINTPSNVKSISRTVQVRHRSNAVFLVRRRVLAAIVLGSIIILASLGMRTVLADRGAAPAGGSAIRQPQINVGSATPELLAASAGVASYIVQPGDTLWSIGQRFHGSVDVGTYVDRLVVSHGGAAIQIGDSIRLP